MCASRLDILPNVLSAAAAMQAIDWRSAGVESPRAISASQGQIAHPLASSDYEAASDM